MRENTEKKINFSFKKFVGYVFGGMLILASLVAFFPNNNGEEINLGFAIMGLFFGVFFFPITSNLIVKYTGYKFSTVVKISMLIMALVIGTSLKKEKNIDTPETAMKIEAAG